MKPSAFAASLVLIAGPATAASCPPLESREANEGHLLVAEKPGRMGIVGARGEIGAPLRGLPPVDARGQGGLLDVALSPSFASDRTVYWSFSEQR